MRLAVALTLAACLAGCGKPAPSVQQQETAKVAAVGTLTGFDRVFASPQETIGALNQAGFGLAEPSAAPYREDGHARMLSNSFAKAPNAANVSVSGAAKDAVDSVAFTLALTDAADAKTARTRYAQMVGDFLTRFKIPGFAPALDAVRDGKAFTGDLSGATVAVEPVPAKGDAAARLDVTFTRSAANAANSKTQG